MNVGGQIGQDDVGPAGDPIEQVSGPHVHARGDPVVRHVLAGDVNRHRININGQDRAGPELGRGD